jgi:hypothetical protein
MELASMLAGGRFGDRPVSVCPVIGAILRAYNDNIDDHRRQDLYGFAADAVDTRRDYRVQRRRADLALDWAIDRYRQRGGTLLAPPDPEGPRDEIGYYVVGALVDRGGWSDDEHAALIALVDEMIELEPAPALDVSLDEPVVDPIAGELRVVEDTPLIGNVLEQIAQPLEHRGGYHEFVLAESLQCSAEPRLEARTPLFDQPAPAVGERGQHDAPVAVGTAALHEAGCREPVQHFGDTRRAQVGGIREIAERQLTLVAKAEQQAVLRVGELARAVGLAPAHPSQGGQRSLERSRNLLGGVALVALAYHVAKSR